MNSINVMWGVIRYEFRMQIRRPALWLTYICFALLIARTVVNQLDNLYLTSFHYSSLQLIAAVTLLTNWLTPLGIGIFLADRLPRDQRIRVDELLTTLPGTLRMRLLGKYLGCTLASLVPALLVQLMILGLAVWKLQNWMVLPIGLFCYAVIALPGMLFVAAFSLACPRWIWVPLYQFLFFGYWFWGNLFSPIYGLPTLSNTILTPMGSFITAGLFRVSPMGWTKHVGLAEGLASLVALLGVAVLVNVALYYLIRLEQVRQ
ncbi:MAG: hypothetical protein ACRDHZ_01810 [Ktedonobacteraceae bacterium]